MQILLINTNPVVSRLLALCTRDDAYRLEEVTDINEVSHHAYALIFVDEASYNKEVAEFLQHYQESTKVLISYRSDAARGFDVTIKKPFLPSQITEIINTASSTSAPTKPSPTQDHHAKQEPAPHIFPLSSEEENDDTSKQETDSLEPAVLDRDEIEKIKNLLEMDEDLPKEEMLSPEDLEVKKVELITEQLMAEGLEIVKEDEIVEELSLQLDGTLSQTKPSKKKSKKRKKNARIKQAIHNAYKALSKKEKKRLLKGKEVTLRIKLKDSK